MKLPFTVDEFLELFAKYNLAVWPMQVVLHLIALAAVYIAIKRNSFSDKFISLTLAFFWLWMGIVYHLIFFTAINKAAWLFGFLFIVQGFIFLLASYKKHMSFEFKPGLRGITGALLMGYSFIIYPMLGYLQGRVYPSAPGFGLPCPTTIFTFALLLWCSNKVPFYLFVIPLIWSIIGFTAALKLGILEDYGLLLSGLVTFFLLTYRFKKYNQLSINK